jgi:hypothetical protein
MASRPCHSRFGSPISAGVNTTAVRWTLNEKQLLLEPRRPDKAKPPSGNGAAEIMPDGAYRLSGLHGSDCSSGSVSQMQHSKPLFNRWLLLI